MAADVAMLDSDNDGSPDYAYAVDTGGNIYRIDFVGLSNIRLLPDVTQSSVEISQKWRAKKGIRGNVIYGKNKVETLLAKWHPLNNLYVGLPNNSEFNLAIDLKELREKIYLSYTRRNRLSIFVLTVATTVIAGIEWLREESAKVHLALALASLVFLWL